MTEPSIPDASSDNTDDAIYSDDQAEAIFNSLFEEDGEGLFDPETEEGKNEFARVTLELADLGYNPQQVDEYLQVMLEDCCDDCE